MKSPLKRTSRRIQAVLGLACLGLVGLIYRELDRPQIESEAMAASAPAPVASSASTAAIPRFTMPPLRDYAEVAARPLFSETRRPVAPDTPRGPVAPPASFTLIGIVVSERDRHALIEHGQPPRIERVAEGQQLDGWTIDRILPGKILVRNGNTQEEIKPKDKPPSASQQRPPQRKG